MSHRYDLLIFDWDGTLMDSEARILACMRKAAESVSAPLPSEQAIRDIIGLGLAEAIACLYPHAESAWRGRFAAAYQQHFLGEAAVPSPLFEGAEAALDRLAGEGYLLAVATGKARRGLERAIRLARLDGVFHTSRCSDETRSKPDPLMLEEILTDLDTDAGRALMIGDTEYDMQMAANAGVDALAVAYGVQPLQRLMQHRPVAAIESIAELPGWLQTASWGQGSAVRVI